MADLAAPAPFEPEKSSSLHDRAERPKGPTGSAATYVKRFSEAGLALLLTTGFVALCFQTRAAWEGHRDWVVPATIPVAAIAAIALAGLLMRRQIVAAGPGLLFLFFALGLTGANLGADSNDTAQDVLTITTAVLLGIAAACFIIAFVAVEWTRPIKAPAPEM
jgi:hypothetical protein